MLRCPYVRHHLKTLVNASKGLVKTDLAVADMTLTDEDTPYHTKVTFGCKWMQQLEIQQYG